MSTFTVNISCTCVEVHCGEHYAAGYHGHLCHNIRRSEALDRLAADHGGEWRRTWSDPHALVAQVYLPDLVANDIERVAAELVRCLNDAAGEHERTISLTECRGTR